MREDLRVGYVLKQYPRLSETFILNEILGLEQAGVGCRCLARHTTEGRFHPDIASVRGDVHYLPTVDKAAFLAAVRALPELNADQLGTVSTSSTCCHPIARPTCYSMPSTSPTVCAAPASTTSMRTSCLAAHTAHIVHLLTGVRAR